MNRTGHRVSMPILFLAGLFLNAGVAMAGDPPVGPPWQMDLGSARFRALCDGRPVFVYFTKTY
jgi:hypothetical protein